MFESGKEDLFMKYRKRNSKSVSVFKIILGMLKETCTFLFAIAMGILDLVKAVLG